MAFRFYFFTETFRIKDNGLHDNLEKAIYPLVDLTQNVVIEKADPYENRPNSGLMQSIYDQYLQFRSETYKFKNR